VFHEGRVNLVYRFDSEGPPAVRLRLKIEINTREHFTELGHVTLPFSVESRWFKGKADVTTFAIEELLGTKLRALYQRKKGRDLFDLFTAIERKEIAADQVVESFLRYMREGGHSASRAQIEANLAAKRTDSRFSGDIAPLLSPGIEWNMDTAMETVLYKLVSKLPGERWREPVE
jgi:predicted nucleotidyltransferase component of viral defense system